MPELPPAKYHPHPAKAVPLAGWHSKKRRSNEQADRDESRRGAGPKPANPSTPVDDRAPLLRYAELHCVTNFTFHRGASHPDELVHRACELGYHALAITDESSLAGVVRAHVAAKATAPASGSAPASRMPPRLKLIVGAEVK